MYKPSRNSQIDHLNDLVLRVAKGDDNALGPLSVGEAIYVALAANRVDYLKSIGYTIPEALARLGADWVAHLVACWQYAGDPARGE